MTASAFVVSLDGSVEGRTLRNGVDTVVVWAKDSTDAKAIAEASFGYVAPAVWAGATATAVAVAADMTGWSFRVRIIQITAAAYDGSTAYVLGDVVSSGGNLYEALQPSTGVPVTNGVFWQQTGGKTLVDCTVVGASADVLDDLGTDMAAALNATSAIASAAYDTTSNVLTVADTSDNLGDQEVIAEFYPAGALQNVAVPGFVVSQVDQGSAGDALTVTLAADSYTVPNVIAKVARS